MMRDWPKFVLIVAMLLGFAGCGEDVLLKPDLPRQPVAEDGESTAAPDGPDDERHDREPAGCEPHATDECGSSNDDLCDRIESMAGECPGYGYACFRYPVEESACFLELLELMNDEVGDVCFIFDEQDVPCAGGEVSVDGFVSCVVQDCFGMTTYESCMAQFETMCAPAP